MNHRRGQVMLALLLLLMALVMSKVPMSAAHYFSYDQKGWRSWCEYKCRQDYPETSHAGMQNDNEDMARAFLTNKLYKTKASWLEANETCFSEGGHLAIPNSKAEKTAVMGLMNFNDVSAVHVGFNDIREEGRYTSVLREPMDSMQTGMWDQSQPSGGRRENCAVMLSSGKMHDYPCTTAKFAFICEIHQRRR